MSRCTSVLARRAWLAAGVAGVIVLGAAGLRAQTPLPGVDQAPREKAPTPKVTLDLPALLTSDRVFSDQVDDPVWQLRPSPGRRLIELPLSLEPVAGKTAKLDAPPPIEARAGLFVGYSVPKVGSDRDRSTAGWADRFSGGDDFDSGDQTGGNWGASPSSAAVGALPEGASRLTRELSLSPRSVLSWELTRNIPNGEIRAGNTPYQLKLRPDRLRDLMPERPEINPPKSNEDRRAYLNRRRQTEAEFRDKMRRFRDQQQYIRKLPDSFSVPAPPRVWALFQVVDSFRDLTIQGSKPLPWTISLDDLKTLREVAGREARSGREGVLPTKDQALVNRLRDLARRDDHPLTYRAIAHALVQGGLAGRATPNDPLYRLLAKLIHGPDDSARRVVLRGLATTLPPTPATASLLREAADQMGPQLKLLSLRSLFRAAGTDRDNGDATGRAKSLVTMANRSLQDAKGPPAHDVIAELIAAMSDRRSDAAIQAVAQGVDFTAIPDDRLPGTIAVVVAAAATQPVASHWLSQKLLANPESAVVSQTTRLIAAAKGPPARSGETDGRRPRDFARGGGGRGDDQSVAQALERQVKMPADPAKDLPVVTLTRRIPIDSTDHGIYQALNSSDATISDSAWAGLDHFVIADGPQRRGRRSSRGSDRSGGPDRFDLILTAAMSRETTPAGVVDFLAHQPDTNRATRGLIRVAAQGDAQTARKAVAVLMGSDRPVAQVLGSLPRDTREGFARRLYAGNPDRAPLVAGLARAPGNDAPVVRWLGEQVAAGRVPDPADWAGAMHNPDELLDLAASNDPALAKGAVAALARAAGGDADTAADLATRFAGLKDRSEKAIAAQWAKAKKDIYATRLASAAGSYRLSFALSAPDYDNPRADASSVAEIPPGKAHPVAVVDLSATSGSIQLTGQTVTLSIPSERFAIRMDQPSELKNFDNAQLTALPLDRIKGPIDLLPNGQGAWRGVVKLPDGRWFHLRLDPTP